jgi:hypothetical protein
MLDLDVGFLESPKHMVQAFVETPIVDIFVQVSACDVLCLCILTVGACRTVHQQHCVLPLHRYSVYSELLMLRCVVPAQWFVGPQCRPMQSISNTRVSYVHCHRRTTSSS